MPENLNLILGKIKFTNTGSAAIAVQLMEGNVHNNHFLLAIKILGEESMSPIFDTLSINMPL